jgi:hypothetical protein
VPVWTWPRTCPLNVPDRVCAANGAEMYWRRSSYVAFVTAALPDLSAIAELIRAVTICRRSALLVPPFHAVPLNAGLTAGSPVLGR